jgi:uncharacterized protein YqiB (DUF1249 family)
MKSVNRKQFQKALQTRDFASLMALYERNYQLLNLLISELDELPTCTVSIQPDSLDLHLEIIERCKYTTTLHLTYYFPVGGGETLSDPGLTLKMYHDAEQAEALACLKTGFMPVEHSIENKEPYLDCRWESNMFVEKWLRYCLNQGHAFGRDNTPPDNSACPNETPELA